MTENDTGTVPLPESPVEWRFATKVAFRYAFVYFGLYVICTQMITDLVRAPNWGAPSLGTLPPMSTLVMWVIRHVFHDDRTLAMMGGSGDKMFDWVQALCLLLIATVLTGLWSVVDRRRANYTRLHRWFLVFLRFALGSTLIAYGAGKAIPLQMPAPPLTRLLEPYGNFSPMGVLWYSIGASRPYEMFTGSVELLCGVLLFIPRTQLLGASIALAATAQVFALNMTYDVPVKLFSFHLVMMSLTLLVPDVRRVCQAVFYQRVTRLALAAQVVLGAYLIGLVLYSSAAGWYSFGGGAPKPPLYGIWVIDRLTIDGVERPPLVTDSDRWRRIVIQAPTSVTFWRMDDTGEREDSKVDLDAKTISFSRPTETPGSSRFRFEHADAEHLVLDGAFGGRAIHMETHLFDRQGFLLVNRGFHWIQELPFNK
jgi:hypothetical protein